MDKQLENKFDQGLESPELYFISTGLSAAGETLRFLFFRTQSSREFSLPFLGRGCAGELPYFSSIFS